VKTQKEKMAKKSKVSKDKTRGEISSSFSECMVKLPILYDFLSTLENYYLLNVEEHTPCLFLKSLTSSSFRIRSMKDSFL
jgi:hypothetical protein